ncbi:2-keto-4-pentenoate hydratase [Burkholderia oklahomensis]|uniref:Fumarylacetoacetate (FAA) hydrolase family protein n=1 Tax=Burkholderia oklahomensis TaxID=342113 RepID=A0AAI8BCH5_9BURK|nr:fumarylacetoacetate hydrolase family protein [Burkholderia oklahomensis]AIO69474.1 fumarylacetoacetate (FAA) hydrolase family protein [Burkholderia oklahomensis]AOI39347.1 2-keto-4-pentenoate hydratase [Burkholderia oklahomensis EO147]KUY47845.1 2-keto-4-pentenoate hydratase [Burkholderia oklahomensis EO147]QPS40300.1 fumarylacetoacetate hydrolase family protein [Burkholderia oklahomensis]
MTNTFERVDGAARHLVAARRAGVAGALLPDACRPDDIETALAIQKRVVELLGEPVGGWKCALPPPGRVVVAPILSSTIHMAHTSAEPFRVVGTPTVRIEPEIAFVLDRDLPPLGRPYSEDEVRGAIRETRLAIEVLGCRYADPARATVFELLADGQFNQGLCVGPVVSDGLHAALDAIALEFRGGLTRSIDGRHPDGHPFKPLRWLVNFLAARGESVRAGQIVTTGSYAGAIDVPLGQVLTVRFGQLGGLSVELVA